MRIPFLAFAIALAVSATTLCQEKAAAPVAVVPSKRTVVKVYSFLKNREDVFSKGSSDTSEAR